MPKGDRFVPTSVSMGILTMLRDTHARRGIGIFRGPPGIGKSSAVKAFETECDGQVVVLKLTKTGKQGVGARVVMQEAVQAVRKLGSLRGESVYLDTFQVKRQLTGVIDEWARKGWTPSYSGEQFDYENDAPPLTFVFDEAQNLSKDAIESLRYWNDRDHCFAPFPIGLAFVGNNEFSLKDGKAGKSVISDAVDDRAMHKEEFDYQDVEDGDVRLILAAHGIVDAHAVAAVVGRFGTARRPRSIRRLTEVEIPKLKLLAGDAPVTLQTVQDALAA